MNPLAQAEPVPPPEPPQQPPEAGAVVGQPVPAVPGGNKAQARQDLVYTVAVFGAVLIGVAVVLAALRYWTRRQTQDCDTSSLGSFREMYENGELSEEEYERVRDKMAAKMKNKLGIKPGPSVPPKPGVGRPPASPPPETGG